MSNQLLDYVFPITAIIPTPAANASFLKKVILVVSPAEAVTPGVITACTNMTQVAALTDNEEAEQLFAGGLSSIYILPMDDLDLEEALEGQNSTAFTVLIWSDFTDEEVTEGVSTAAVKAQLKVQDILYRAVTAGTGGNAITINYDGGGTAGLESVVVVGTAITVTIEDGVSTAQDIADAIAAEEDSAALVEAIVDSGDELDPQDVFGAAVSLLGGVAEVSGEGLQLGTYVGVVGVSSDDEEFLADQAIITNRVAFYGSDTNKAQSMCYAFGKFLSAPDWANQQYIPMPLNDGIESLGESQSLFDAKISFVITDDEFGDRLGLFAVGSRAIFAPYVIKNLQLDMQSDALAWISGNQPEYTKKNAALLETRLEATIAEYIADGDIEAGTVEVTLNNDGFVAEGDINVSEPKALWIIEGIMRQTL